MRFLKIFLPMASFILSYDSVMARDLQVSSASQKAITQTLADYFTSFGNHPIFRGRNK